MGRFNGRLHLLFRLSLGRSSHWHWKSIDESGNERNNLFEKSLATIRDGYLEYDMLVKYARRGRLAGVASVNGFQASTHM